MTNTASIANLKTHRRWVLWRLENTAKGRPTKRPYQPDGRLASSIDPATWHTFAELEPHVSKFSGIGLVLGTVDGVSVWGVDIDRCCDVVTGKFSPESREVVIALDTYTEYSPSGTGCHLWGIGTLPGAGIQKPFPGAKQIEVKSDGYYQTYTGRHITKTPASLENRQEQVIALYHRANQYTKPAAEGLNVGVPVGDEERFKALMAGDLQHHDGDHSRADFALCILLAQKFGCDAFKIDDEFRTSGLYRDKWERADYRQGTITRAVLAVAKDEPVFLDSDDADALPDDGVTTFLMENPEQGKDGFFPFGEVNCVAGPSGAGKTAVMLPALEHSRLGEPIWGFTTKQAREYRILLHDRSKKSMMRTAKALHLSAEAQQRIIRLSRDAQKAHPATVLEKAIRQNPGVDIFFIEGLDLWIPDMNKMEKVAPIIDELQRVAYRANVCLIASVGAPKQKGKDRYFGRDSMFGSAALARKVETVVLIALHDETDQNSVRHCLVLPRTSRAVSLYFQWTDQGLTQTVEPAPKEKEDRSAMGRTTALVHENFKQGEPITHNQKLGPGSTFYRWRGWAIDRGLVFESAGQIYLSPTGVKWGESKPQDGG